MSTCIFCEIVAGTLPSSRVYEDGDLLSFMDIYPWRPGHTLVIPKVHCQRVDEMTAPGRAHLFETAARIASAMRRVDDLCDDVHFMINDGPAANQSVPHVHMHVLPRRRGDLARLCAQLIKRPLVPLLPPAPRRRLDAYAARLAGELLRQDRSPDQPTLKPGAGQVD